MLNSNIRRLEREIEQLEREIKPFGYGFNDLQTDAKFDDLPYDPLFEIADTFETREELDVIGLGSPDFYRLINSSIHTKYFKDKKYVRWTDSATARNIRTLVMKKVSEDGHNLRYASEKLKNDYKVVHQAIKNKREAIYWAPRSLRTNNKFLKKFVFKGVKETRVNRIKTVLKALESIHKGTLTLEHMLKSFNSVPRNMTVAQVQDSTLMNEASVVLALAKKKLYRWDITHVPKDRRILSYTPKKFGKDKQIVMAALKTNHSNMEYAHDVLTKDKDFVMDSIKQGAKLTLQHVSIDLRKDREVALLAVKQTPVAFVHIHDSIRWDEEFILNGLKGSSLGLSFIENRLPKKFRESREFAMKAVKQRKNKEMSMLNYLIDKFKNDKGIVMEAIKLHPLSLQHASGGMRGNKEVVMMAVKQDPIALYFASDDLKNDKEVVMAAIIRNGNMLGYASDKLRSNKKIVLAAVGQNKTAIGHAMGGLDKDPDVIRTASGK